MIESERKGLLSAARYLFGRDRERAALDVLLSAALSGTGGGIVLLGEPGIGKTALLGYAIEERPVFRVARGVGVESEMEIAFAALQQLCSPFLGLTQRLPDPQRAALEVAFGLGAGPAPNPFLVGLAVLGVLAEAAEEQPLLCVIDDAQWLDSASASALGFATRRLLAEKIAIVFATREPVEALAGVLELRVEPLGRRAARALLESVLTAPLEDRVLERIVAETQGNPLALIELPQGLTPAQLAGGFGLPAAVALSTSLEESFTRRLARIPYATRRLLLLAAADPTGDPSLVWRAAGRLGIPQTALQRAESEDLLALTPLIAFRHPLIRSAVYGAAGPSERREVHGALADATDPHSDPDRRAWHRAHAAAAPDEAVADELERSAARAQARGGLAAAAAFLERAVALTPDASRRAQRALAAAQTKFRAGGLDDALGLLEIAESGAADDEALLAQAHLLRAQLAFASRRGSDAPPLLLRAARELEAIDPNLARDTYLDALSAARFAGPLAGEANLAAISRAALAGPSLPESPLPSDLLLQGLAVQITQGNAAGALLLKAALSAFERASASPAEDVRSMSLAFWAAGDLWDDGAWRRLTTRALERAREQGALTAIPLALSMLSYIHAISGELVAAEALLDEIRAASEATGTPTQLHAALWIAALRGRETETHELIRTVRDEAAIREEGYAVFVIEHVTAVLHNGFGRYGEARDALRRQAVDASYRDGSPRPMAELIEAAVRTGELELARLALGRLVETTSSTGTNWAAGIEARSRALLSEGKAAESLYREAIDLLGRTTIGLQVARSHLVYGEWLHVQRRSRDARDQLRMAYELLSGYGAGAFAGRALLALQSAGGSAGRPSMDALDPLTSQEAQIARLAAEGHTNREIGARLFISASTVEYHLGKVFRKLDVKSRVQLSQRLS